VRCPFVAACAACVAMAVPMATHDNGANDDVAICARQFTPGDSISKRIKGAALMFARRHLDPPDKDVNDAPESCVGTGVAVAGS